MNKPQVKAPEGAPTFVFTDIEASSALWEAVPQAMARALRAHDALMHGACDARGGYAVKAEGDAFMVAFHRAEDAIGFAILVQQTLARLGWPKPLEKAQADRGVIGALGLRVRIGVHQGVAERRANPLSGRSDYFGAPVNIAARLCDMAHGAQILVSEETLKQCGAPKGTVVSVLGPTAIRGMKQKVRVHQMVSSAWWPIEFPPLRLGRVQTHDGEGQPVRRSDLNTEMEAVADQLLARGQIDRFAGAFDSARHELNALLAVVAWLDDDERLAECYLEFGAIESNSNNFAESLSYIERALALLDAEKNAALYCRALIGKSTKERVLERYAQARKSGKDALALSWKTDDTRVTARARATLAELDRMEGKFEQAEAGLRAAIEVLELRGDRSSARSYNVDLGVLLVEQGHAEGAEILERVVCGYRDLNMMLSAAAATLNLSLHALDRGDEDTFLKQNQEAHVFFDKVGNIHGGAACILNRSFMHLAAGRLPEARQDLDEAAKVFPVHFEAGTDMEAGILHAWLAFLEGDEDTARQGCAYFASHEAEVQHLLGPMTLDLLSIFGCILARDWDDATRQLEAIKPPASVTFRLIWRSMKASLTAGNKA